MDVRIFKLITGEEILGDLQNTVNGAFLIKNPAIILMQPGPDGKPSLGLMDYLPLSEKRELTIRIDHVITQYHPKTALVNHYNQLYGNGLVIPGKSGLVL